MGKRPALVHREEWRSSSPPTKIAAAFYELLLNGEIEKHFYVSAVAFLAGLGLSIIVGLPVGLIIGRSPTLEAWLDPYIQQRI